MAFLHTVDAAARLVTISGGQGKVVAQAAESTHRLLADTRIESNFRILILADPNAEPPSDAACEQLAQLLMMLRKRICGRIAIAAPTIALAASANLVALLSTLPRPENMGEIRAFAAEAEARAWILDNTADDVSTD